MRNTIVATCGQQSVGTKHLRPSRLTCRLLPRDGRRKLLGIRRASENGSTPATLLDLTSLDVLDINGKQYIAMAQAREAMEESNAASTKEAVRLLEERLSHLQDQLNEKEEEAAKVRRDAVEAERAARAQLAGQKDAAEEMATMRERAVRMAKEVEQAQAERDNAVQTAVRTVETKLSSAYVGGRDRQLARLQSALDAALKKERAASDSASERLRGANTEALEAAKEAAESVAKEADAAVALARAQADAAVSAAKAAADAAAAARTQQAETAAVAEQLFAEAAAASERAGAAHTEARALQEEVQRLRARAKDAVAQRDAGLRKAVEKQAHAIWRMRHTQEMCEHRIQEMQNAFEAMKNHERDGARQARDETADKARRCEELESRERELLAREGELREALAQAAARAVAAEEALDMRSKELTAEHVRLAQQLTASMEAESQSQRAEALAAARESAQQLIDAAAADTQRAVEAARSEQSRMRTKLGETSEALEMWEARAKQHQAVTTALDKALCSVLEVVPEQESKLRLSIESKLTELRAQAASIAAAQEGEDGALPPKGAAEAAAKEAGK